MVTERRTSARAKTATRQAKPATATRATRVATAANSRKKVNPLLIGGIAGGAILILGIVLAFAISGGRKGTQKGEEKSGSTASKSPAGPKVDPKLHKSGVAKCEQGLGRVRAAEPRIERRRTMNPAELESLRKELEEARRLLIEGMAEIEKSGAKEHTNEYQNAIAACRNYLKELSGK
ncbi:MAG: hypothetical protein HYY17_02195 [Planctomycetes bacterium]|nr:hypothetical protein [Planctomycetota bacterium]